MTPTPTAVPLPLPLPSEHSLIKTYWRGYYDACSLLTRSPRMNRSQLDIITDVGLKAKDELERLGVKFLPTEKP